MATKTRELHTVLFDSGRWNNFKFRDGDIVIATWAKSGTTWMQQIAGQLIFDGAEGFAVAEGISPWLDLRLFPVEEAYKTLEAQAHRRFIKTHLPLDALVFSPQARYIFIGRDGRDVAWSWYNHQLSYTDNIYEMMNSLPGRVGSPMEPLKLDVVPYFRQWIEGDGYPLANFWEHTQGWWDARRLPNVLLVHFNKLKADLSGEMKRIADFLDIEIEAEKWPALVEHCTFDYMRQNASTLAPYLDMVFKGGGDSFLYKGTNGRWRDMLTADDIAKYERAVTQKLTPDCARWLETGEL